MRPSLVLWGPKEAGCAPFCSYTKTQTVLGLLQGQKPLHNSCESSRGVLGAAGSLPPVAPPAFTPKRKSFSAFWGSKLAGGTRGEGGLGAEHRFEPAFCSRMAFLEAFSPRDTPQIGEIAISRTILAQPCAVGGGTSATGLFGTPQHQRWPQTDLVGPNGGRNTARHLTVNPPGGAIFGIMATSARAAEHLSAQRRAHAPL